MNFHPIKLIKKNLLILSIIRAIASHLQTCGCSIVIGNSVSEINLVSTYNIQILTAHEGNGPK